MHKFMIALSSTVIGGCLVQKISPLFPSLYKSKSIEDRVAKPLSAVSKHCGCTLNIYIQKLMVKVTPEWLLQFQDIINW